MTAKSKVVAFLVAMEAVGFVGVCFAIRLLDFTTGRLILAAFWTVLFARRLRRYMS